MSERTLLVVGATGLLGRAALLHFKGLAGWRVLGMSRRTADVDGVEHLEADLMDPASVARHRDALASVTHVLYAALFEMEDLIGGWRHQEQMDTNLAMFKNLLGPLESVATNLAHVAILQGTKAYGIHVEPMRAPARERWPRHDHENFYWLQEDYLIDRQADQRQAGKSWTYSIWRPQVVFGHAVGSPMNLLGAIAVYASMCKEKGEPCRYPGGIPVITEATDARLLARAMEWSADNPDAAANQTFNITNGEVLIWPNLWPFVCDYFGVEEGEPIPQFLAETMPEREALWAEMVQKHDLAPYTLKQLIGGSWQFLDRATRPTGGPVPPSIVSNIKLRQAGFPDCYDNEQSLTHWFDEMRRTRVIPGD
ncbi:MAG: SDR family oxidoreductase [Alphaproteobacteria bacterium]|jgi:nucleoside-diphosphate-sugar epimerase|nr:SDR family oxidoreductase [Alphaproteobacteria bacterium]